MNSDLSFLGTSNTPTRKRYSIAAFPVNDNLTKYNNIEAIEISLDIFDKDNDGNTSLMKAIQDNRPLAVQNIMKKAYTTNSITRLLNSTNKKGETPLKLASEGCNLAIKEYLEGIKVKKINPLLENIKISTGQTDELIIKNMNILPEIIKPNMFGTTERDSFIPTIAENENNKISNELLLFSTPRLRSISIAGEPYNGNNALQELKKVTHKKTSFPSQDLKDVISINELGKNKKYSSADTGIFSKKSSTASSKISTSSETSILENNIKNKKPSLPKYRHVDGAVDITTNFFPIVKDDSNIRENPETNIVLMLTDKVKNFVKKKESFQGYTCYDTQLLYMPREEDDDNNEDLPKSIKNTTDYSELNEYRAERYGSSYSPINKVQKNEDFQIDIGNTISIKNRSQSLCKILDKSSPKY
ncbi:Ankyrin repeat-containing domain-containing protein [Strongyloides ratti]|uniref:Ankyrin repeat-containing domain-containing protein n=1 Tax=Strongyloides ratti TaxID=34506 RepID=A0A090KYR8_STRRB|nr:Ankyrin repeat-containing domain-containing protein [Strongyloides ratti]CEF60369.1 Ankyrin repeat-containing domain-containing protein [Strongyloides ratti]